MSLRDLNLRTRRRLRWHAWLLTLWCVFVGFATSWVLLHAFGIRFAAVRYAIAAIIMYSLGLVVGARIWLVHFSQSVLSEPGALGPLKPGDVAFFERRKPAPTQRRTESGRSFDWGDLLGSISDFVSFDEAAGLLVIPAVIFALVSALLLIGVLPLLLMNGVAGLLAEVAVQFVFGALIARQVILPKAHDAAFMTIVARTWLAGLALVVASTGAGWLLWYLNPDGATLADLFR